MGYIGKELCLHISHFQRPVSLQMLYLELMTHPHVINDCSTDAGRQQQIRHICKRRCIPYRTDTDRKGHCPGRLTSICGCQGHLEHISASGDIDEHSPVLGSELPALIQPCKTVDKPPVPSREIKCGIFKRERILAVLQFDTICKIMIPVYDYVPVIFLPRPDPDIVKIKRRDRYITAPRTLLHLFLVEHEISVSGAQQHSAVFSRNDAEQRTVSKRCGCPAAAGDIVDIYIAPADDKDIITAYSKRLHRKAEPAGHGSLPVRGEPEQAVAGTYPYTVRIGRQGCRIQIRRQVDIRDCPGRYVNEIHGPVRYGRTETLREGYIHRRVSGKRRTGREVVLAVSDIGAAGLRQEPVLVIYPQQSIVCP